MTDAYLMDADCVHGVAWYDCDKCNNTELYNGALFRIMEFIKCYDEVPHFADPQGREVLCLTPRVGSPFLQTLTMDDLRIVIEKACEEQ